jgi:hypothetical protein
MFRDETKTSLQPIASSGYTLNTKNQHGFHFPYRGYFLVSYYPLIVQVTETVNRIILFSGVNGPTGLPSMV